MAGRILIGTSGFSYPHWRGVLYPEVLPQRSWLERYCEVFGTVEINATFYGLPKESTVQGWYNRTPADFVFAVKASRFITHIQKLAGSRESMERFLAAVSPLGKKLGPFLFQFPPGLSADIARLGDFLALLPAGRRYAFEFRHNTWFREDLYEILRERSAALVLHDYGQFDWPRTLTAKWTYLRLHGPSGRYTGEYGREGLQKWADILSQWAGEGMDVYVYFNNDFEGNAVRDAVTLAEIIHGNPRGVRCTGAQVH